MKSTISERVKHILGLKKMDQKTFSDLSGLNRGTISAIIIGKTKAPGMDFFQAIATLMPEINLRWLLLEEEPMILPNTLTDIIAESAKPFYPQSKENEVKRLMVMIEQQQETIAQMVKLLNDIPALRLKIEQLEKRLEKLEG